MLNRPSVANPAILLLATLAFSTVSAAQLIDTKDASNISLSPSTTAHVQATDSATKATPEEDCFIEHYDGFVKRKHPEKLHLEIISAESHFVDDTTEIVVSVRLKNEGRFAVTVPWQTDSVEPAQTGGPNDEVSYEAASLRLTLGTQENRNHRTFLQGRVEFQAVPHSYEQHVKLLHGQWVEVKFKALAKCLYNDADPALGLCPEFKADEHAQLAAHWGEGLFTQQAAGCHEVTSHAEARRIDSDAVEFDYVPANTFGTSKQHSSASP